MHYNAFLDKALTCVAMRLYALHCVFTLYAVHNREAFGFQLELWQKTREREREIPLNFSFVRILFHY